MFLVQTSFRKLAESKLVWSTAPTCKQQLWCGALGKDRHVRCDDSSCGELKMRWMLCHCAGRCSKLRTSWPQGTIACANLCVYACNRESGNLCTELKSLSFIFQISCFCLTGCGEQPCETHLIERLREQQSPRWNADGEAWLKINSRGRLHGEKMSAALGLSERNLSSAGTAQHEGLGFHYLTSSSASV